MGAGGGAGPYSLLGLRFSRGGDLTGGSYNTERGRGLSRHRSSGGGV